LGRSKSLFLPRPLIPHPPHPGKSSSMSPQTKIRQRTFIPTPLKREIVCHLRLDKNNASGKDERKKQSGFLAERPPDFWSRGFFKIQETLSITSFPWGLWYRRHRRQQQGPWSAACYRHSR
jgi:hypothetical protein